MFEWLAQRSGENILTEEEQLVFWSHFAGYTTSVREKKLSIPDARKLVKLVSNVLKAKTTAVMRIEGFVFDGLLGYTGGGKALLYHVIEVSTGLVKCGKVYRIDKDTESVSREIEASTVVHGSNSYNPYIVRYEIALDFSHQSAPSNRSIALIMTLYQLTLAAIIEAFFATPLPMHMFNKVAICVLSAGSRFCELNMAHCDIKPENVMMLDGEYTVIDLGAVCKYGEPVVECTLGYYLDAPIHIATPIFDLNCAAVTLARCCIPNFTVTPGMSRASLLYTTEQLMATTTDHTLGHAYSVLKTCLTSLDCNEALVQLQSIL